MKVRIEVSQHDRDGLARLHKFEEKLYPGEHSIVNIAGVSILSIEGDRIAYLEDLVSNELNDPAFESFVDWKARRDEQADLFETAAPEVVHVEEDRVAYA